MAAATAIAPLSGCPECLAPLEVHYDLDLIKKQGRFTRAAIAAGPFDIWRYAALLPIPEGFEPDLPVGFTPLVPRSQSRQTHRRRSALPQKRLRLLPHALLQGSRRLRRPRQRTEVRLRDRRLLLDRQPANSVAAQAARLGLKACILIPADLEPAKILNTLVYGARLVRIDGNYDHVNRLCTLIADEYSYGFVNVNLRPYYAEGSKTQGYEIVEQLGWRLPDNVVCPMAGGSLIRKLRKAFNELIALGLVEDKPVRFFGAQATGCSPISHSVREGWDYIEPQRPNTIARSLAIGNPADGPAASKMIRATGGWAEDVSDVEVVSGIQELAETEGIFTETAGGVTTAVTARLYAQGRIERHQTTVVCITGNGLKTTRRPCRSLRPPRRPRRPAPSRRLHRVPPRARRRPRIRPRRRRLTTPAHRHSGEARIPVFRMFKGSRSTPIAIKIILPTAFVRHTEGQKQLSSEASNLPAPHRGHRPEFPGTFHPDQGRAGETPSFHQHLRE